MGSIIQDIPVLSRDNVHIKNEEKLKEIVRNMCKSGVKRLQVVSDFDKTITKQHENGIPHMSSFGKCLYMVKVINMMTQQVSQPFSVVYHQQPKILSIKPQLKH